jgi:hypothetical protein
VADPANLVTALDDLAGHLTWPVDSAGSTEATDVTAPTDVTARAVAELRTASEPGRLLVDGELAHDPLGQRRPSVRHARRAVPRPRRRVALAAAAIVAAVLVVSAVPPTRQAVADLLGMGRVRITQTDSPFRHGSGHLDLGEPVTWAEARRLAPGPLPRPPVLGAPTAVFAGEPAGGVTLVWAPDERLPEVGDYGVGLLITAFPGSVDRSEDAIEKRTTAGGTVESTEVNGEPAYWLGGVPHEVSYLDEHGETRQDTIRLSGHALVWAHDGVTYRLESALALADALRLAESLPQ